MPSNWTTRFDKPGPCGIRNIEKALEDPDGKPIAKIRQSAFLNGGIYVVAEVYHPGCKPITVYRGRSIKDAQNEVTRWFSL